MPLRERNNESIGSLLFGFFDLFARIFSPQHHAISIRRGSLVDAHRYRTHRYVLRLLHISLSVALCNSFLSMNVQPNM
jgi:DNA polymerase sigma